MSDMPSTMYDDHAKRFNYHPPSNDEIKRRHEVARTRLREVADEIGSLLPPSRELSLFVTKLEEAMFWANAAIARNHDKISDPGKPQP